MVRSGRGGSLQVLARRHRRGLAALAAGLAVLMLGTALVPPRPGVAEVVVAARDLPAGHRLGPPDLALASVPDIVGLHGQPTDGETLVGQVLAAPMLRGEPVSTARLLGASGRGDQPAGTTPMPVRFADPDAGRWLTAGQRIDVLAARSLSEDSSASPTELPGRVVGGGAVVLAVPGTVGSGDLLDPADQLSGQGDLVLLAVTPDQALAIAGAQASSRLSYRLAASESSDGAEAPVTGAAPDRATGRGSR